MVESHRPTAAQIIARKRDGQILADREIDDLIAGYCDGSVPDYQMAAWAMAVYFQGMQTDETARLTSAMLNSGRTLTWSQDAPVADKHSTGGVGDKVSLILAPLLACCGIRVPMISGRGLGPTGGTLDKLESIPGYRTDLAIDELQETVRSVGCVITGASPEIAPADRSLYALRDVTGTVPSIPLITASILSKKLAEGLDGLVLDVKWGSGAFMKDLATAKDLASSLTATARRLGLSASVVLTDMNQPLGRMIGNTLEVDESIEVLKNNRPAETGSQSRAHNNLLDVTLALGSRLLVDLELTQGMEEGRSILERHLASGEAYERFARMVRAQGGDIDAARERQPPTPVLATRDGYLQSIDCEQFGLILIDIGGGRRVINDSIDPSVGMEMMACVGDRVTKGQPIVKLCTTGDPVETMARLERAFEVGDEPVTPPPLIQFVSDG